MSTMTTTISTEEKRDEAATEATAVEAAPAMQQRQHPHYNNGLGNNNKHGVLKVMIDKFSSTPLQENVYTAADEYKLRKELAEQRTGDVHYDAFLTVSEREYLSGLLQNGDSNSITTASQLLKDDFVFPKPQQLEDSGSEDSYDGKKKKMDRDEGILCGDDEDDCSRSGSSESSEMAKHKEELERTPVRRNSLIQQQLFRLHETEEVPPSTVLQRMNYAHKNSIMDDSMSGRSVSERFSSSALRSVPPTDASSILQDSPAESPTPERQADPVDDDNRDRSEEEEVSNNNNDDDEDEDDDDGKHETRTPAPAEAAVEDTWNPFEDISSWLDGSQGVEVTDQEGPIAKNQPMESATEGRPFKILGTSADDVSCHPHLLSPPLMESLLAFVPEYSNATIASSNDDNDDSQLGTLDPDTTTTSTQMPPAAMPSYNTYNFWLKYSLVRDGPGLWNFLRQVRASTICFLAIETTHGHVFGAFTTQPWRLSKGWYGSSDTFLWKMRRPRSFETTGQSIVQQVCQESEIQVYPYRTGNAAIQYCSKKCLMLGQGEVIPSPKLHDPQSPKPAQRGKYYGYGLYLDKDLKTGTTSSSETFGSPCLLDAKKRGARFAVANIEVWTLTPHDTVEVAEQSELSNLFLDGGRDGSHRLNFINILVGGPI